VSRYFEDYEPGQVFRHAVTRTITDVDNLMFTCLTHNDQPLHLDEEFGKKTMYGTRIAPSFYTLAFVSGASVEDLTVRTMLAELGYGEVRFPHPVRIGDTLRAETKILSKRESRKYPNAGIVMFEHAGYNQREEVVVQAVRAGLMFKKAHAVT